MASRPLSGAWPTAAADSRTAALVWVAVAILGGVAVSAVLGGASATPAIALLLLFAAGSGLLWMQQLRRPLIALLFFLAPIDISKALIASTASRFYAAGPYYSPGLYLSIGQMALLALFAVWLGRRLLVERRMPPLTRLDALAFAYLAVIWVRSIGTPQGLLSIGTAAGYTLLVLGFYVVSHAVVDRADLRVALGASLAVLVLTLSYVVAQSLTHLPLPLPGAKGLAAGATVALGDNGEVFRPPGFMNHPNSLAHYLVIVLPILLALLLTGRRRLPRGVWTTSLLAGLGAVAALLVTLSRGGWAAALLAGIVVVGIFVRRRLIGAAQLAAMIGASVFAVAALLVVYPSILLRLTAPDGRSLESRGLLVDMAYTIIRANPWFGVGFGDYNRAAFSYHAPRFALVSEDYQLALHQLFVHNHYLLVAAELGIPAMLLFAWLLWQLMRQMRPLDRWLDAYTFALATGLTGAIAGQALFLASDNYDVDIRMFLLWMSAGLLQSLVLQTAAKKPPPT